MVPASSFFCLFHDFLAFWGCVSLSCGLPMHARFQRDKRQNHCIAVPRGHLFPARVESLLQPLRQCRVRGEVSRPFCAEQQLPVQQSSLCFSVETGPHAGSAGAIRLRLAPACMQRESSLRYRVHDQRTAHVQLPGHVVSVFIQ